MPLPYLPRLQRLVRPHRSQTSATPAQRSRAAFAAPLLALAVLAPAAHCLAQQAPQPASPVTASPGGPAQAATPTASPVSRPITMPGAPCLIAEFRTLALDTHDPTERERVVRQWLRRNLAGCSLEKLTLIGSNRAAWLGTADSATIMGKIDTAIEARVQDNPALLAQLFDALPRTFAPSVETIRTEPARPIIGSQGGQGFVGSVGVIGVRPMEGQAPPYPSPGGLPWLQPPVPAQPTR